MGISSIPHLRPDTAADVLTAARDRRRAADAAEADLLELAVDWASMHSPDSANHPAGHAVRGFGQTDLSLAGAGAPAIAEFAVAEFAAAVGLSTEAGKGFLGEALELCFRLPAHWRRVASGELPAWKGRRVARETIRLAADAAAYVDTHVAPVAHKVRPTQLDRAVNEAIGRFMPAEVERLAEQSWDKRHVTLCDQLVSFTGTMRLEAEARHRRRAGLRCGGRRRCCAAGVARLHGAAGRTSCPGGGRPARPPTPDHLAPHPARPGRAVGAPGHEGAQARGRTLPGSSE